MFKANNISIGVLHSDSYFIVKIHPNSEQKLCTVT